MARRSALARTSPRHIAYFGGAFDPPHMGHLLVATYVRACLPDAELWIAPSARHPYGKQMASFEQRLAWCELLAKRVGGKRAKVFASDIERRTRGLGRTLYIVRALKKDLGRDVKVSLVIGADNYDTRHKWYRIEELERLASFFVLGRGTNRDATQQHLAIPEVSSTEIRERLRQNQSCEGLVPSDILSSLLKAEPYSGQPTRRSAGRRATSKRTG